MLVDDNMEQLALSRIIHYAYGLSIISLEGTCYIKIVC